MKLIITVGCAACGFSDTFRVDYGLDCSDIVCPKCRNDDGLSITSVTESAGDNFKKQSILKRLRMIQEL